MWKKVCAVWCGLHIGLMLYVEGITISIDPTNSVSLYKTVSSVGDQFRTFTCRGGIQANTAYMQRVSLSISRLTRHELKAGETTPKVIALVLEDQGAKRPDVMDILDRNRVPDDGIAGTVNKVDYRQSDLSIKFNTVAMKCDDAGQYFCNLDYRDKNFNQMPTERSSENFTVSAIPDRVDLTGQPDIRRSGDGSINFPYEMQVGDVIELDCNGRIGGDPNVQWEWKKTAESGALIKFVPSSSMYIGRVNETRGPAIPVENECTNTRKTTLRYTITTNDQNVKGDIQFQCYTDSQGANLSSSFVYIRVEGVAGPISTTKGEVGPTSTAGERVPDVCSCKECDGDLKAAVVGGCLSVVIVILSTALVFILLRQHNCCKFKENPTYEIPQRSDDNTLNYDTLQQPGANHEVPEQRTPHIYTNTNI